MAKEYVVEKAFIPKDDNGEPKSWSNDKGTFNPWMVKVEGQDFWFSMNKKPENEITPGDTLYGLFDEEEYTNGKGEKKIAHKFVKQERKDGSRDIVQSLNKGQGDGQLPAPTGNAPLNNDRLEYLIGMTEKIYEIVVGPMDTKQDDEEETEEPINLDDINL